MLRTNLATRPFYNERLVHVLLGVVAVVTLALTSFNVTRIVTLSREHTELSGRAQRDEGAAGEAMRQAAGIRRQINSEELETLVAAVREANALIDRRTFSWTDFFNRIEATLPSDVMLLSVRPEVDRTGSWVSIVVVGRAVEDIDAFMENLEKVGAFAELLARQEEVTEEGMYRTTLRGRYVGRPTAEEEGPDARAGRSASLE